MPMPVQKPGKSKQDYETPKELIDAVCKRMRINQFTIDLAASPENTQCDFYFTEDDDALSSVHSWNYGNEGSLSGWAWLNPPYTDIEPWVRKAAKEAQAGAQIIVLVPASVGANWWRDWVEPYAYQTFLNGRIQFVGAEGLYPKDCALLLYTPWQYMGHEIWSWKRPMPELQQRESSKDQGVPKVLEL